MNGYTNEPIKIASQKLANFFVGTFSWFSIALFISFVSSFLFVQTGLTNWFLNSIIGAGAIFFAQISLVFVLSFLIEKLNIYFAGIMFLTYSLLSGLTLSVIYLIYDLETIISAFGIASAMFAVMAAYGYFTKQDLTKIGTLAYFGVFGLIIASVVNFFVASTTVGWFLNYAAVGLFLVLIAWDTQRMKMFAAMVDETSESFYKYTLLSGLNLYIDFIVIFKYVLRIIGGRN